MSRDPEPTELIHLPKASALPALVALGLAGIIIGLYAWWPYSVAGAIVFVLALVSWMRRTREDIASMPREQRTDTAPIPLSAAQPRD
jgi:hypothetical protein